MQLGMIGGLGVLRSANVGNQKHGIDAETTPLRDPEHYRYDLNLSEIAEVWRQRRGSVIVVTGPYSDSPARRSDSFEIRRPRIRLRRGSLDHQGCN